MTVVGGRTKTLVDLPRLCLEGRPEKRLSHAAGETASIRGRNFGTEAIPRKYKEWRHSPPIPTSPLQRSSTCRSQSLPVLILSLLRKARKVSFCPRVIGLGRTHGTNAENEAVQRRGPKGYFQGSRKDFLESRLPAYIAVKKGRRQSFWHSFWSAWWQRYPWKLEDDQEPPKDNPERMARLASVAPGEEQVKKEVEQRLREVCRLTDLSN